MAKVVTFGEIMLRLAPEGYNRFVQAKNYGATFGGGEANVAVSLAEFGVATDFVTKLPAHEIGQAAVNTLRQFGVGTGKIVSGGERVGIYYLEKGAAQRASKVIYDRKYSSISLANSGDFDWKIIFAGAEWFHFTGITPALGGNLPEICLEACKAAKTLGLTVSCDLNYRKNLWSCEDARKTMIKLVEYVDVCIANEEDASDVFGITAKNSSLSRLNDEAYISVADELARRFGFSLTAITLRESISASDNIWSGLLYDGKTAYTTRKYPIHIVDRVGGGDSFCAGLIYGRLNAFDLQKTLDFAVAASCLKHSIEGDLNLVSVDEVLKLMQGDGSGRVQR